MKHTLQSQRGETIVEVLVSFLLLMIFTSMFVVSLRYARAMSQKAETLRETAYELCAKLYGPNDKEPKWDDDGAAQDMTFGNNDFTVKFTVKGVQLQSTKQEVKVSQNGTEKTEKYVFHRYCNKEEEGTTNP